MKPSIFLSLLLALGLSNAALAQTTTAVANTAAPVQTELFSTASSLQKSRSCFSGPFQSYDSYIAFRLKMAKNNPNLSEAKLRVQLPQADYEGFMQKLDCPNSV